MFTGREYAGAFGFYEYRARAYHPGLGRFTSEDPKLFDTGDYNLYRYCHNDPLDFTDPMGTSEEPGVKPPPTKPFDPVNPFNRSSGTGYSIDKWGPPGSFGKMDLSMAQLGQETRDRVILGGNATKPMDDPSHYTDEKLRNERGPAAEQTTTRLIANDDGTVSANVDAKVRRNLATRDPGLLPREWQHVNDWKNWIGRMNLPNSDLSTTFRNSPWDLKAAEAIRNFLAPYQRNEFITQKLRYDFKGGPHDVDYGLRE